MLKRAGKLEDDRIGLTVNTVTPGFIATEMLEHVPEKVMERISRRSRSAASASPRRSRASCTSSPPTRSLHHGPGLGRQRRAGHVSPSTA